MNKINLATLASWRFFLILFYSISINTNIDSQEIASWSIFGNKPTVFSKKDVTFLPASSHTGSIIEYWYLSGVLANADTAGFSLTEKNQINMHGSSGLWQRFYINGADITDPANPGSPVIDIPIHAWQTFSVNSIITPFHEQRGFNWNINPSDERKSVNLSFMHNMGGPTFIPAGTFDREPGDKWGASEERRQFKPGYEGSLYYSLTGINGQPALIFAESVIHQRKFLQLNNEISSRSTAIFTQNINAHNMLLLGYQLKTRENEGIEWNNKPENTLKGYRQGTFIQWINENANHHTYMAGAGFSSLGYDSHSSQMSRSLEEEIHDAELPVPEKNLAFYSSVFLRRDKLSLPLGLKNKGYAAINFRFEGIAEKKSYPSNVFTHTYADSALNVLLLEPAHYSYNFISIIRPVAGIKHDAGNWNIDGWAGLAYEGALSSRRFLFDRIDPVGGIKTTYLFKSIKSEFYIGAQHEAIRINLSEISFINQDSLSGTYYGWNDLNNDGLYQAGEESGVLSRTGGSYHTIDKDLKSPVMEELSMGFLKHFSKTYSSSIHATTRLIRNLYFVRYDPAFNAGYTQVNRYDTEIGYLYDRQPGTYGQELYQLTNNPEDSMYFSLEIQVIKQQLKSWWFFNFSVGTYFHLASPPPGNGPFFNDIGQISESTADPNNLLYGPGRTDYDRGYMANLIMGFEIIENLSLTNVLHYRDGQPFAAYIIAEGLSQGPIAVIDDEIADGFKGIGRYTFYLSWDIRIRYQWEMEKNPWALSLDIYNLLDSRVPLYERLIRDNRYRRPAENIPPRSFRLILSSSF